MSKETDRECWLEKQRWKDEDTYIEMLEQKKKKSKKKKAVKKVVKNFKCTIWKHDFHWEGKKKLKDVCCRYCGKNMVEWTEERHVELEKKLYG